MFALNPPSIPGLGTTGGFEFYVQNRGSGDTRATGAAVHGVPRQGARSDPSSRASSTTFRASTQQLFVDLDRNKAEVLGVPVADVFQTMQAFFGSQIAGQFSQFSRVWWVILQADASYRMKPEDFDKVYVRSRAAPTCRCRALITTRYVASPKLITRFNGFPAGEDQRQPGAGLQLGPGADARWRRSRSEALPRRLLVRVGGPGAAGEGIRRHVVAPRSSSA